MKVKMYVVVCQSRDVASKGKEYVRAVTQDEVKATSYADLYKGRLYEVEVELGTPIRDFRLEDAKVS